MPSSNKTQPYRGEEVGLDSLDRMRVRLNAEGGKNQQDRMIHNKNWSLQHAIKYSYQSAKIRKWKEEEICPALINPDKVKQNYDDKILSVGWEFGFKAGDIFEWINTKTMWLITLQELTELAYFRSEIRRCNYTIGWQDIESGETYTTYAAVRGPIETELNSIQKNGISVDNPNYSLEILMPKNTNTLKYFKRYAKFYLKDIEDGDNNVCWRITATDSISMPGILQVLATEYYANEFEDDKENGIAGGLIVKPLKPENASADYIEGPALIKPKTVVEYTYRGSKIETWSWDNKLPIKAKIDGRKIKLVWLQTYSSKFTLYCGTESKEIAVGSLF